MQRFSLITTGTLVLASMATAQDTAVCDALYDRVSAGYDIDFQQCVMGTPSYTLAECTPPHDYDGALPNSHLILALDVSGSMAGQIDGETKMAVAQREALAFLDDLEAEIAVALVLYGHTGDNTDAGRAVSCASPEMVHGFDTDRSDMRDTISSLTPTGWTPLGGTLNLAAEILDDLPNTESDLAPVVYLISDGEETCDSGPVEAAERLYTSGVQTTVNTIGFAVDSETRAQLEAIAAAGGGTYYSAETASALNAVLNGIRDSEASYHRFQNCVFANSVAISGAHQATAVEFQNCAMRYDPNPLRNALMAEVRAAEDAGQPESQCLFHVLDRIREDTNDITFGFWLNDQFRPMIHTGLAEADAYYESQIPGR